MDNYEKFAERIRKSEGLSFKAYKCPAGALTIGYGHNLDARGISIEAAELLLRQDIEIAYKQVKNNFPLWPKLEEARLFVLVDMCFNMGLTNLYGFKKMWAAIEKGDYDKAAQEMLNSHWAKQVGKRAVENSIMMKTGKWIGE